MSYVGRPGIGLLENQTVLKRNASTSTSRKKNVIKTCVCVQLEIGWMQRRNSTKITVHCTYRYIFSRVEKIERSEEIPSAGCSLLSLCIHVLSHGSIVLSLDVGFEPRTAYTDS